MTSEVLQPDRLALRLGFWSALGAAAMFIAFTVCFVAVVLKPPLFVWTSFADYVVYARNDQRVLKSIAQLTMLLFAPLYVALINSLHELAPAEKKAATRLGLACGVMFAALSGGFYFVQLSAVRLSVAKEQFAGLEQVVQANPYSALSALNMLGWTVFFGLSSLCVAPAFAGSGLVKAIRWLFVVNGLMCLLGGIGYVLEMTALVFVTINLGMGGAVMLLTIALCLHFRRMGQPVTS